MDEATFNAVAYQIANAQVRTYPYPHFYLENVFPSDFYDQISSHFPDLSHFMSLVDAENAPKGTYDKRFVFRLERPQLEKLPFDQYLFWSQLAKAFSQKSWMQIFFDKFHNQIRERFSEHYHSTTFYSQVELISDGSHYAIGPHTDHSRRILSLLFYLPESEDQSHLGTSLYLPKEPHFTCNGSTHHKEEDFIKVFTAPFVPNSVFGFVRSDRSFHGVGSIGEQQLPRRLLNYTLYFAPQSAILF